MARSGVILFRTNAVDDVEEIAQKLGTTKSEIVRLCVNEGIRRIRSGEFRFTIPKKGERTS